MRYHYIDFPQYVSPDDYHRAINRMVDKIRQTGMALSIYQVGSIGTPGISDIDLLLILHENLQTRYNPVKDLEFPDRYLFAHRLFGTVIPYALQLEPWALFDNYLHLWGKKFNLTPFTHSEQDRKILERQIALEYLLKAWISISSSISFGTVQVRNLLLHAKGILHDLRFLDIRDLPLESLIHSMVACRETWFSNPLPTTELDVMVDEYESYLKQALKVAIATHPFYMPEGANLQVAKRIRLHHAEEPEVTRSGLVIPSIIRKYGDVIRRVNGRLSHFSVGMPMVRKGIPEILNRRFKYLSEAFYYNDHHLPGFICTGHGLNIFSSK